MLFFVRKSLGNRIMATIIVCILLMMGVEIALGLYFGKKDRLELMETLSMDLAASTYSGIRYPMSVGDSAAVAQVLADIREKMEGIEVFICDSNLLVTWSTHRDMEYTNLNEIFSGTEPLTVLRQAMLSGQASHRSYETGREGDRHLVVIAPILNEAECYHCHGSSRKVIGGMVVRSNIERTMRTVTAARNRSLLLTILALGTILVFSYTLVEKFINRRLARLTDGVKKISAGDLDIELPASSPDEIGELASSFNTMARKLKEARDEITNWTLTLEDLVEERTEQLKRVQESAIQAEKMASMGRLAAIVAHEINNPLAGIRTYAKLLMKRGTELFPDSNSKYIQYIETIESESARCGEIVRGLLQFSRPSKPHFGKHDINTLARESLRLVQHQVELLNIEVKLSLGPELPLVHCDDQKIKQALVALLLNACDAVQKDAGVIEVRTGLNAVTQMVEIAVQDNGIGMDEQTRAHIFEPFFTTKTVSAEKEASLNAGLGGAVVYEIVKAHGGSIDVTSEKGKGSTITIALRQEHAAGGGTNGLEQYG